MNKIVIDSNLQLIFRLFPFHFVLNRKMELVQIGTALAKLLNSKDLPIRFTENFEGQNFIITKYPDLINHLEQSMLLSIKQVSGRLKGMFFQLEHEPNLIIFIGSLMLDSKEQSQAAGLDLSDFAPYDFSPNLFFVLQTQKVSIQEVSALANRLKAQKESLEAINEELGEYTYVVSHDLQTPIRSIVGFAQLLLRSGQQKFNKDERDFLGFIINSGKRMHALTQDLLDYSRFQSRDIHFESVDLNVVLKEILIDLNASIQEAGATIEVPVFPVILADRKAIHRVFQNLLDNALKFNKSAVPNIYIRFEERSSQWYFEVEDNGIGIDAAFSNKIFKVFQKLHLSNEYAGNGIGLSICKKIIQEHGGEIGINAMQKEGTCFYFTVSKELV